MYKFDFAQQSSPQSTEHRQCSPVNSYSEILNTDLNRFLDSKS